MTGAHPRSSSPEASPASTALRPPRGGPARPASGSA